MQQKIHNFIEKHQLLNPGGRVIVGVSGGADSVVLLHILLALGYKCVVAHCNFHLRMSESDRDEEFVRILSNKLNIPFYQIDFDTVKYSETHKISIEMAARELRYNWFHDLLGKTDAEAVAVAHHADDSIETLLMNLVRGTGLRGLTGIPVRNEKTVRPLLCCTRLEIESYIVEHKLEHIVDSTNATLDYQRNKFRNSVLPLLEKLNPSVRRTLYDSLERFSGSLAIYQQAIEKIRNELVHKKDDIVKIDINLLKKQVHPFTVLFELLQPYSFHSVVIEQIVEQLDGESGKIFYSDTHRLIKDRNFLIIGAKNRNSDDEYYISQNETEVKSPVLLKVKYLDADKDFLVSKSTNRVHFDADKLSFPLRLRRWHEGDSFFPFGMNKRKKISDFFINNKLSILEKEKSWLLVSGEDIIWIVGLRTDNRYRITEKTIKVLELQLEE
jgi:tRNA(Ile)-lysidine synthase